MNLWGTSHLETVKIIPDASPASTSVPLFSLMTSGIRPPSVVMRTALSERLHKTTLNYQMLNGSIKMYVRGDTSFNYSVSIQRIPQDSQHIYDVCPVCGVVLGEDWGMP